MSAQSTVSKATKRRKVVHSEGRSMIASVYHFLKEEIEFTKSVMEPSCDLSHLRNITQRTAVATGVSLSTVQRILKEEKELPWASSKFTSAMNKRRKRDNKIEIDNFTADVVRSTIQNFHVVHKEIPTLAKLRTVLNEKIGFEGCLETLRQLLLNLGYKWRKTENNRKILTERHDIQIKSKGFDVIRLPPYHPELNAIENIWGIVKNYIASKNIVQNMTYTEKLINESLNRVTSETWHKTCSHVEKIEKEYLKYVALDFEFMINLQNDSDDSESESEDESDSN